MNLRYSSTKNRIPKLLAYASATTFASAITLLLPSQAIANNAPHGSGSISLSGAVLIINGTELNDRATVTESSGDQIKVLLNGKSYKYPAASISEIQFIGLAGDDDFVNRTPLLAMAFGGDGDDLLKSTDGIAMFYGGLGDDSLLGSPNDDFLCGGSDDDVIFGFNGNDQISGDAGSDGGGGGGGGDIDAELSGMGGFARGKFVEVGVNSQGTFGAPIGSLPSGFYDPRDDGRARNGIHGFIADTAMDGFAGGSYDGDFFTPGSPEEGFGVEIAGTNFNNNTSGSLQDIPGMLISATTASSADINWRGSVGGLDVARRVSVFESGLFIRLEVTLTNTTGANLRDIYYMNNVDPDNDQTIHGNFSTFNTIVSQGDLAADNLSLVTAQQTASGPGMSGGSEATGSALSLVSFDPRARVSFGGFGNRVASDIYNADGTGAFTGAVGAFDTSDIAISLAFDVGTLTPGQSTKLVYYYSLDPTGVDISGITEIENACADGGLTGDDIVYGGNGDDIIDTEAGEDIVYGGADDDMIDSGRDADKVYGQSGNDTITTGPGNDEAHGGSHDDTIIVNAGNDRAFGNSGSDFLGGGNGNDYLHGGSGDDTVAGHRGNDDLRGGGGDDNLYGGPGLDDLNGGAGDDNEAQ
jgi:Ca2+-binding RTX toxin-like protein